MASFASVLSTVGRGLKKFFTGAVTVAQAAEPIIAVAFPGISVLYNATVTAVAHAENAAIVAGAQNGTGAQKLALVVAAIEKEFDAYAKANGIAYDASHIEAWVNAVVSGLNSIPAPAA